MTARLVAATVLLGTLLLGTSAGSAAPAAPAPPEDADGSAQDELAAADDSFFQGDLDAALKRSLRAASKLAAAGQSEAAVEAFAVALACTGPSGALPQAAVEAVAQTQNPSDSVAALRETLAAMRAGKQGQQDESQKRASRAESLLASALAASPSGRRRAFLLSVVGWQARLRGDLALARTNYEAMRDAFARSNLSRWALWSELIVSQAELAIAPDRDRAVSAERRVERVWQQAVAARLPFVEALAATQLSRILLQTGRSGAAMARLASADELFVRIRRYDYGAAACFGRQEIATSVSREQLAGCIETAKKTRDPIERAWLLFQGGLLARREVMQLAMGRLTADPVSYAHLMSLLRVRELLTPDEIIRLRGAAAVLSDALNLLDANARNAEELRALTIQIRGQRAEFQAQAGDFDAALRDLDVTMTTVPGGPMDEALRSGMRLYSDLLRWKGRLEELLALLVQLAVRTQDSTYFIESAKLAMQLAGMPVEPRLARGPAALGPGAARYLDWAARLAASAQSLDPKDNDPGYLLLRIQAFRGPAQEFVPAVKSYIARLTDENHDDNRSKILAVLRQTVDLLPPPAEAPALRLAIDCGLAFELADGGADDPADARARLETCLAGAERVAEPPLKLKAHLELVRLHVRRKEIELALKNLREVGEYASKLHLDAQASKESFDSYLEFSESLSESTLSQRDRLRFEVLRVGFLLLAGSEAWDWAGAVQDQLKVIFPDPASRSPEAHLIISFVRVRGALQLRPLDKLKPDLLAFTQAALDEAVVPLRPLVFRGMLSALRAPHHIITFGYFLAALTAKKLKGRDDPLTIEVHAQQITQELREHVLPQTLLDALATFRTDNRPLTWPIP